MKLSKQIHKRLRPHLGTFVEIALEEDSSSAFADAYEAIAHVERLMSFHRDDSELSRINRLKLGEDLEISSETLLVLEKADELKEISGGVFNVAVGANLSQWRLLPNELGECNKSSSSPFVLFKNTISRVGPGFIDLGGIAKGFAVDQAVSILAGRHLSGYVNAGGDLSLFGNMKMPILIQKERGSFFEVNLQEQAVATSSVRRKKVGGQWVSSYVDQEGDPFLKQKIVSIIADSCIIADGLTKVGLMADVATLTECLEYYNAHALVLTPHKTTSYSPSGLIGETRHETFKAV